MTAATSDRVIVVGGGIAGLVTAYRLLRVANGRGIEVTVLEASEQPGGKLRTAELEEFPVEDGADSFVVRKPWAMDLCRELGLERELVAPAPGGVYVWTRGRLERFPTPAAFGVPAGVENLLRWRGLSGRGRLRAAADLIRPVGRDRGDESIGSLITRRLGQEAAESLVGPLLAGLHAGDANRLSVAATFPELRSWERDHGSLIRGSKASIKAARSRNGQGDEPPMFATVWTGLSRLVSVLAQAIGPERVVLDAPVASIHRSPRRWVVDVGGHERTAKAVVIAAPAFEAARLLDQENPHAASELAGISYVSTAVVTMVYPPGTLTALPPGTGFIVPPSSGLEAITACTFVSSKWPRTEHANRAVVRCFVGRAGNEEWMDASDSKLVVAVSEDLRKAIGLKRTPEAFRVTRWPRAMPQYDVGHLDRVARIEEALEETPGMFVVGSPYRGVGIADCVRQAGETASVVRAYLSGGTGRRAEPHDDDRQEATE
jgi:protoporphyrinogen/coproporphyrinogen III oxidase